MSEVPLWDSGTTLSILYRVPGPPCALTPALSPLNIPVSTPLAGRPPCEWSTRLSR
ncbi:hypothetical protein T484DRAFT_1934410 [Baffinella frigidus]|nr:hypothetical protein T484DRAFT_1934410 [Cryptophyta sp. CCMP2293]